MGLKDVAEWLHYCPRCNSCKYVFREYAPSCPAFEKYRWDVFTSSGKVWMARDLFEGKYELTESMRDKIFSCTLCGSCTIQCQQEVGNHALDIFEALREECVNNDLLLPAHKQFQENIEKVQNPYGEPNEKRFEGIDAKYFKQTAEVLFFVGCTTALRNRPLLLDSLEILDLLGIDFTLSKEEWCCGSPLLTTGQKKAAKSLAEHNVELMKKVGAKKVITACAGCYRSLKGQYPKKYDLLKDQSFEILHISEFVKKYIQKGMFLSPEKIRVTYHDPCHLGRHMEIFEDPRQVIKKIKNVELVEMPRNRDNAWCCGAGAGVKSQFKEWAVEISESRVQEAIDLAKDGKGQIRYIVSACPFCERNISDAIVSLQNKGIEGAKGLEMIDILQLLKRCKKVETS